MAKKSNPRRYAQAVFEIAQENKEYDKWQTDLQQVAAAVKSSAEGGSFLDVLESPRLADDAKARFLRECLPDIGPLALNLVSLLISRNQAGIIPDIAAEYTNMLYESRGVKMAAVTTAVPLEDADKEKLQTQLSALTGATVEITSEVDPGILGGVVARVGGKLLDGSTRTKLAALKKQLEHRS